MRRDGRIMGPATRLVWLFIRALVQPAGPDYPERGDLSVPCFDDTYDFQPAGRFTA